MLLVFKLFEVGCCSHLNDSKDVAFGDSLTAGFGAQDEERYPAVLSTLFGVELHSYGISGEDTIAWLKGLAGMLDEKRLR